MTRNNNPAASYRVSPTNASTPQPLVAEEVQRESADVRDFTYTPLSSEQDTRLLRILPTTGELIVCSLESVSGRDLRALRYTALSYCWGPASPKRTILINGRPFSITENLHMALKLLRPSLTAGGRHSVPIWIDAICINQADLAEKSYQVQHMDRIYRNAKEVLIWLGEADCQSGATLRILHWLHTTSECTKPGHTAEQAKWVKDFAAALVSKDGLDLQGLHNLLYFFLEISRKPIPFTEQVQHQIRARVADLRTARKLWDQDHWFWTALFQLMQRPWFGRVWTAQEVLLAPRSIAVCGGTAAASWQALRVCRGLLFPLACLYPPKLFDSQTMRRLFSSTSDASWMLTWKPSFKESAVARQLQALLQMARSRQAADMRDYVYGVVGLLSPEMRTLLTVDYTLDVSSVYVTAMRVACSGQYGAPFWSMEVAATAASREPKPEGLPTWCPSFAQNGGRRAQMGMVSEPVRAAFINKPCCPSVLDRTLSIPGICVDTVSRCTISLPPPWYDVDCLANGVETGLRHMLVDENAQWLDEIVSFFQLTRAELTGPATTWLHHYCFPENKQSTEDLRQRVIDFRSFVTNGDALKPFEQRVEGFRTFLSAQSAKAAEQLQYSLWKTLQVHRGKHVIVTQNGRVGLSIDSVQNGDLLCYFGLRYLHVLSADGQQHKTIASVHGLMDDALLDIVADEKHWQTFTLV